MVYLRKHGIPKIKHGIPKIKHGIPIVYLR